MGKQRGAILIVVILIAALISIIAIRIYSGLALDSRRTVNIIDSDRAYYYALGAEELALQLLKDSFNNQSKEESNKVYLGQPWAQKGMVFPIDGGQLAGEINDMSACFNLNSILGKSRSKKKSNDSLNDTDPDTGLPLALPSDKPTDGQVLLEELFKQLIPDTEFSPKILAARVRDWLDSDDQPYQSDGAEDGEYQLNDIPYRTGNTLMGSVEELRTIAGFSAEMVETVAPYLCALPSAEMNTLNINTVDENQSELLIVLYENLSVEDAKDILQSRPASGYDQGSFKDKLTKDAKLRPQAAGLIAFDSDRFMINAEALVGRGRARLQSLIERDDKGNFSVISRKFASKFGQQPTPATEAKESQL
jgi:general secretion pathway protein K